MGTDIRDWLGIAVIFAAVLFCTWVAYVIVRAILWYILKGEQ